MMQNKMNLFLTTTAILAGNCNAFMSAQVKSNTFRTNISSLPSKMVAGNDDSIEESSNILQRREALASMFSAVTVAASITSANALDMDAFMNSELESDTKNCDPKRDPKCIPKLTSDEALCKYGQSGDARGEACKRVKESGKALPSSKPQGKSLGGAYAM